MILPQFYNSPALAIETSGGSGSIALLVGKTVVSEEMFPHGLKHAAELLPTINRMMRTRGWSPVDLGILYVSEGPGSFTGLRIGITLAKTLTLATRVKLVAVPTLQVLARNAPPDAGHVIIVLDAKRDQIFTARYERVGSNLVEREPAHLDTLAGMLDRAPRPVCLLGEGLPFHTKLMPAGDERISIAPEDCWRARATVVAEIGIELAAEGRFADPDRLIPLYIRKPEAEEKWDLQREQLLEK